MVVCVGKGGRACNHVKKQGKVRQQCARYSSRVARSRQTVYGGNANSMVAMVVKGEEPKP